MVVLSNDGLMIDGARTEIETAPDPVDSNRKLAPASNVRAFWHAGIAAGGTNDGPPGLRHYRAAYYGAFLRDPDGNKVEAVCHRGQ
ncbi:hypothetical protein IVB05_20990 [Bradyrhizobium sp. 170]|nr:hypothetical protein IVB05_20990 [Bradyrhizobium sp. 170]